MSTQHWIQAFALAGCASFLWGGLCLVIGWGMALGKRFPLDRLVSQAIITAFLVGGVAGILTPMPQVAVDNPFARMANSVSIASWVGAIAGAIWIASDGRSHFQTLGAIQGTLSALGTIIYPQDSRRSPAPPPGQDFRQRDLSGRSFRGRNLQGANFQGANLEGADFCFAKLSQATFDRANCRRANFTSATISGADFRGAILTEATLTRAKQKSLIRSIDWSLMTVSLELRLVFVYTSLTLILLILVLAFQSLLLAGYLFLHLASLVSIIALALGLIYARIQLDWAVIPTMAITSSWLLKMRPIQELHPIGFELTLLGVAIGAALWMYVTHNWIALGTGLGAIAAFAIVGTFPLLMTIPPPPSAYRFLILCFGAVTGRVVGTWCELGITCFRNADLSRATFHQANLKNADFHHAKLLDTDLSKAILTGAILPKNYREKRKEETGKSNRFV